MTHDDELHGEQAAKKPPRKHSLEVKALFVFFLLDVRVFGAASLDVEGGFGAASVGTFTALEQLLWGCSRLSSSFSGDVRSFVAASGMFKAFELLLWGCSRLWSCFWDVQGFRAACFLMWGCWDLPGLIEWNGRRGTCSGTFFTCLTPFLI